MVALLQISWGGLSAGPSLAADPCCLRHRQPSLVPQLPLRGPLQVPELARAPGSAPDVGQVRGRGQVPGQVLELELV